MTDAVPTRTPTALTRRHPQRVVPAEQMTAADQRPGRYLTHGARDASTRPVRPAGNSRGGAGIAAVGGVEGGHGHHRARTSAALPAPAPEVPSGLLLRTFRASRTHRDVDRIRHPGRVMLRPLVSQSTHCHAWSTDGRNRGTRRLTVQDRRMLTAQGWKMTLVRRLVTAPRSEPQR